MKNSLWYFLGKYLQNPKKEGYMPLHRVEDLMVGD